jgi:hypothetical protein
LALVALWPAVGTAQEAADEDASYSYVRTIEGRATLSSEGRGPGDEADLNQPLLQGDTVRVAGGARVEIALADRNLLRAGGDTTVTLARVAFSADRDDRTTRLDLDEGEILLLVGEDALGDELPEIRTPAGTIYVHEPGEYRVTFDPNGGLEVVVRAGYAELLTERGSTVVRTGESAWTEGHRWSRVEIADAGPYDTLERWGEELEQEAYAADSRTLYVEPEYRYAAAPLARYGSWVYIDSTWCWRPRVTVDWRPYWNGRWAWTPSGLTWVSAEPWGWLPYHYGTWYQAPGYGWCWRPGRVYAPAWVYWHIGPSWTGWVPVGYYTHHYRHHWSNGFRFGLYGWAGGSWSYYADWNFCPTRRVYDRYDRSWRHTGDHVGRLAGHDGPHGLLTTDTRGLERGDWARGDVVVAKMGRRAGAPERLPTVTDFVARKRELPPEVEHAVVAERRAGRRLATPLDPAPGEARANRGAPEAKPAPGWRAKRALPDGGDVDATRVAGRGREGSAGVQPIEIERPGFDAGRGGADSGGRRTVPAPRVETRPGGDPERLGGTARGVPPVEVDRPGRSDSAGRGGIVPSPRVTTRPGGDPQGTRYGSGNGRERQPIADERPARTAPVQPRVVPPARGDEGNDRQRWQQGTPYSRGAGTRPDEEVGARPRSSPQYGYGAPGQDSRSTARRVERPDEPPVTRVIGGVRRGAPEGESGSGSPRPQDRATVERPSYRGAPVQPGYRSAPTARPQPSGRSVQAPPTRGAPAGSSVGQQPSSSPRASSPPPSRGNSSATSSRGSSGSNGDGNRSDSSPPKRGGGAGKHGRDR